MTLSLANALGVEQASCAELQVFLAAVERLRISPGG
jgi:hypothetical protein